MKWGTFSKVKHTDISAVRYTHHILFRQEKDGADIQFRVPRLQPRYGEIQGPEGETFMSFLTKQ